jgi:hypothetical protein
VIVNDDSPAAAIVRLGWAAVNGSVSATTWYNLTPS